MSDTLHGHQTPHFCTTACPPDCPRRVELPDPCTITPEQIEAAIKEGQEILRSMSKTGGLRPPLSQVRHDVAPLLVPIMDRLAAIEERLSKDAGMANEVNVLTKENRRLVADLEAARKEAAYLRTGPVYEDFKRERDAARAEMAEARERWRDTFAPLQEDLRKSAVITEEDLAVTMTPCEPAEPKRCGGGGWVMDATWNSIACRGCPDCKPKCETCGGCESTNGPCFCGKMHPCPACAPAGGTKG